MNFEITELLQLTIGLGLINVWLMRSQRATSYRGQNAKNLKEEFEVYGLPVGVYYLVGFLKLASAAALIAGIWFPELVLPAAGTVAVLMLVAVIVHMKVKDPVMKSVPALLMLLMTVSLGYLNLA